MEQSLKRILVIGGNGYIGSVLYKNLLSQGYDVDNVDLCWFGQVFKETLKVDYNTLTKHEINQYSHIILLAGHSSVSMCEELGPCFKNNVVNFINLIEKLDEEQTLIYASTLAVYGNNPNLVNEDDPVSIFDALNYYDYTKLARESIAKMYPKKKIIGLRFGTVGGFSPNFRSENLLNSLSKNAFLHGEITIANGDAYRTAIGIQDVSKAIQTIIENNDLGNKNIYNLGSMSNTIGYFGNRIQDQSDAFLTINNLAFKTQYSFDCCSARFIGDYDFVFKENIADIYESIINNYSEILHDNPRNQVDYV